MHALTAIEAYFTYMGLYWYTEIVKFLASDHFIRALCLLVFGILFLTTTIQLFARQMGSNVISTSYVSVGSLVKVVICYLLGIACLKVSNHQLVKDFSKESWESSPYIVSRLGAVDKDIRLSLPVDLMVRSAEEIGWLLTKLTDWLMKGPHSNAESPNLYYKAMLLAGATTIDDPKLRSKLELYTTDCIERILPAYEKAVNDPKAGISGLVNFSEENSTALSAIQLEGGKTCFDLRQDVQNDLTKVATPSLPWLDRVITKMRGSRPVSVDQMRNYEISSALLNFYNEKNEAGMGVMKGGEVQGTYGRILQNVGRTVSHEGFLRILGRRDVAGVGMAVERAKEFNEQLRTAPMILGLTKAILLVMSCLLPFFIIALKWRMVIWWWMVYLSVCLWVPLWTGLYHLLTNVFVVPDVMSNFGRLTDAYSMYSAQLINDQVYYISAVISWAQIAVGPGLSAIVGFFAGQWLLSNRGDHMPAAIQQVAEVSTTTAKVVGMAT